MSYSSQVWTKVAYVGRILRLLVLNALVGRVIVAGIVGGQEEVAILKGQFERVTSVLAAFGGGTSADEDFEAAGGMAGLKNELVKKAEEGKLVGEVRDLVMVEVFFTPAVVVGSKKHKWVLDCLYNLSKVGGGGGDKNKVGVNNDWLGWLDRVSEGEGGVKACYEADAYVKGCYETILKRFPAKVRDGWRAKHKL